MAQQAIEEYIQRLADDQKDAQKGRIEEHKANDLARSGADFTIEQIPENYRQWSEVVSLPLIQDMSQRIVAIMTSEPYVYEVPPQDETEKSQRNTSLRERWITGAFDQMEADANRPIRRMAMDDACCKGLGVQKLIYLPDAWAGEPLKPDEDKGESEEQFNGRVRDFHKGRFPFGLIDVTPENYYPVLDGRGKLVEVLEIGQRPLIPSLKSLGLAASYRNGKFDFRKLRLGQPFPMDGLKGSSTSVEVIEYWSETEVVYLIEGQVAKRIKTNYGRPPYSHFGGYTTASREPGQDFRSVFSPIRDLVRQFRRLLTMWMTWGVFGAFPFLVEDKDVTGGSSLLPEQQTVQNIKPGSILRGVKFLEPPSVGRDLVGIGQILQQMIDRSGLPSVMYGTGAGVSSGYMTASLQAAAQSVYKPILFNACSAQKDQAQLLMQLVEKKFPGQKVYVYGSAEGKGRQYLGLSDDDIKGYYAIEVTLKPLLPMDEIAQRDSVLRMFQGGLYDPETALKKTGEGQPEEIIDKVRIHQWLQANPQIMNRVLEDAATRAGLMQPQQPQQQPMPQVDQYGQPLMQQGPGGMPPVGPIEPTIPGVPQQAQQLLAGMAGAGGPPVGVPRQPGGNFGEPVG